MIFNINRKSSGYWSEIFLRLIDVQSRGECYLGWWPYYSHTLPSLLISPSFPLEVLLYPLEISLKVPLMGSPPLYSGWSFSRHFNLCNDCMIVRFLSDKMGIMELINPVGLPATLSGFSYSGQCGNITEF